jgi:cell division protein FtsB
VSAFASDIRSSSSEGIWHSLNKIMFVLIALCVSIPIGYSFLPEVSKRKEQTQRIEALKAELEKQRALLVRFEREEMLLKRDPEYAGFIARDKLDLMHPGETIYRLEGSKPDLKQMRRNP